MDRILTIILCVSIILLCSCKEKSKEFKMDDYKETIANENFKYNGHIKRRSINDDKEAKIYAEKIWLDIFGNSIKEERPYVVYKDKDNAAWLVHGTIRKNTLGGTAWIIFNNNGDILAVWHEK